MNLIQVFAKELKRESATTRKLLERVPEGKADWQPHTKSMAIGRLASHIAEIPGIFVTGTLTTSELDFTKLNRKPANFTNTQELLQFFDDTLQKALQTMDTTSNDEMVKEWTMRKGEQVILTLPKRAIIRTLCLNHIYHHRGQLSVYLRLLDVAVPSVYGPSADEMIFLKSQVLYALYYYWEAARPGFTVDFGYRMGSTKKL